MHHGAKMINRLEISGNFLLSGLDDLFFLTIDDLLYLRCFLHDAIEPIDARNIGAKIQAQRRIDAQKPRNRDGMLVIDQKRMLLRWAAVLHDFHILTGYRCFDADLDLLKRFHDEKAVIPSEVEGSRSIASSFRHGIPRLRFAPLGMTKRESSLDHRRLKNVRIRGWLQIMLTKLRHGELAWLVWLENLGLIRAGQLLFVDLALQFHKCVKQRFWARRTAGDVNIDRNITVDAFEHIVTLLEWST